MSQNNYEWNQWWDVMRELEPIRRSRAICNRCRYCGRGKLNGCEIKKIGKYENVCEKCDHNNNEY